MALAMARQRQRDWIAAADRSRLAASGRRSRDSRLALGRLRFPGATGRSRRWLGGPDDVRIRPARPDDARALHELAILSEAAPLEGDLLVAEVGGRLWAASSLDDGRTVADPFRPTRDVRSLLELRRAHLASARPEASTAERTSVPRPGLRTDGC
jgi:hypothetical protein